MVVDLPKVAQVMLLTGAHPRFLVIVLHVVVAAQVKDPVGYKMRELGIERVAHGFRLPNRRRERDRDIAQQFLVRHALHEVIGLIRERQHIRWSDDPKELEVHRPNLVVIGHEDSQGSPIVDAFAVHHAFGKVVDRGDVDGRRLNRDLDGDVVRDGGRPLTLSENLDRVVRG